MEEGPDRTGPAHATCAWCRQDFATIADLFDHVDAGHDAGKARAA